MPKPRPAFREQETRVPHERDRHKKHIEISLGMACNNKCLFCLNKGPRKFVPFAQVVKEAEKFAAQGYNSVGFIGGDPTIYPNIADLGCRIRDAGFKHIHIISNGRRFHKIEFLDALISAGFNRFSVSIHSHRAEVEDRLTGIPGGHDQKISGLKNLLTRFQEQAFRDRVAVNIVMNKLNVPDLDDTIRFFSSLGVTDMRLLIIRPEGRVLDRFDELVPRLSAVREVLPQIIRIARKRRLNVMIDTPPLCLFYDIPGFHNMIAEDYIDEVIADAAAQERTSFSWNEFRVRNKDKAPFCGKCVFNKRCEGVWQGYVKVFGFDEFRAVTEEDLAK